MDDNYAIAAVIIFVIFCWILAVAVWRGLNRRLNAWREIIKKGDTAYLINMFGEKAMVEVLAVDRTKPHAFRVRIEWHGMMNEEWVDGKLLFPLPKREGN